MVSRFAGVLSFLMRVGIILAIAGIVPIATDALGQAPGRQPKPPQRVKPAEPEAPFSPTIGGAGFSVPIPEIKMESIVGERRAPKPPPPPPAEAEQVSPKPPLPPEEAEQPPSPPVRPTPEPSPPPPPAAEPERPEAPVEPAPSEAASVEHLPFQPPERAPRAPERAVEPPPTTPAPPAPAEPSEEEDSSRFVGVPTTPEEVLEAPIPVREILQSKPAPKVPDLLEGQTVKTTVPAAPLKATAVEDAPSEGWIPLDSRREMGSLTPPAPPAESPPTPPVEAPPQPEIAQPPEPRLGQPPEPVPLTPPIEDAEQPEEELPPVEPEPERPLPEIIPSPLENSALDSGAVREYLTASVPVLEELSLLMTRVPSLDVGDFDPSETDPAAGSTDLLMKMDSLKRELQVLDSKTFSIIPPSQYVLFHSLIRESITQTYQACEAMIAFMQNRKEDDLTRVREHISKARDLLGRTRKSSG